MNSSETGPGVGIVAAVLGGGLGELAVLGGGLDELALLGRDLDVLAGSFPLWVLSGFRLLGAVEPPVLFCGASLGGLRWLVVGWLEEELSVVGGGFGLLLFLGWGSIRSVSFLFFFLEISSWRSAMFSMVLIMSVICLSLTDLDWTLWRVSWILCSKSAISSWNMCFR